MEDNHYIFLGAIHVLQYVIGKGTEDVADNVISTEVADELIEQANDDINSVISPKQLRNALNNPKQQEKEAEIKEQVGQ